MVQIDSISKHLIALNLLFVAYLAATVQIVCELSLMFILINWPFIRHIYTQKIFN